MRGRAFGQGTRGAGANLALAAVSLGLALLAAEAGVRLLSPIGPALLVNDPGVGKRYVPGFHGRVFVDEAERHVEVRINSRGFRGPEWSRRKPAGGTRLVVLGDSMTAALGTDEERTFVRRLEASLSGEAGAKAEVMNFGVASASTGSELLTWRSVAAEYAPDLVLLAFFNANDLADNSARLTRAPRVYFDLDPSGLLRQGPEPAPTPAAVRWLDRHSRLYTWQKVAFRRLRSAVRSGSTGLEPGQRIFARGGDPDVEHAWKLTGALVGRMREEVEATGARFGVVVIPCAEQVDEGLWADLARRARAAGLDVDRHEPSRRLAALLEREGVASVDLAPAFDEAARRSGSGGGLYLLGRFHLSDEGHRLAAEAIRLFLTRGAGRALLEPR